MDRSEIKIMVVNDKVELRNIIRNYLKAEGYTNLSISENGLSALHRVREEPPQLMIADFDLPEMSGLDLLKAIRRDRGLADLPFILISSEHEQMQVALAAEYRVSAYVIKPFSHRTLADKVNKLMNRILNPSTSALDYQEANRLAQSGNLDAALEKYQKALDGAQRSMAALHYKIGRVHEQMDERDTAETDYREAVGMSDQYVDALDALGRINLESGNAEEAKTVLSKGVGISPLNAWRQLKHGEALLETGDLESAEYAFRKSLELDPNQAHAINRLGITLRRMGRNEEAELYLSRAAEMVTDDENLFYNLSRVYKDRGDYKKALINIDKALDLNPDFKEALDLKVEMELGRPE